MENVMNGNKYNPEESNLNQETQYSPNIEKKYDQGKNPLKQGKSDEELELENQNKDVDSEEEDEEEENA